MAAQHDKGYEGSAWWGTYKSWQRNGGQVRKGEKSTAVILFKMLNIREEGDDEPRRIPLAKAFHVFHAAQVDQTDELVTKLAPADPLSESERHAEADRILTASGVPIVHGGGRACYSPREDRIMLPMFESFKNGAGYYSTAFHELGHATGHESRLARTFGDRFGDPRYALEELTAELCSALTCQSVGLSSEPRDDHAHYIASWLRAVKDDPTAFVRAASQAQAAADWIGERVTVHHDERIAA